MSSAVDSSAWVSHFRNLSEIDDKFTERLNELKQKLSKLENSTNFNELDFPINNKITELLIETSYIHDMFIFLFYYILSVVCKSDF
jgi:hypothetical protein